MQLIVDGLHITGSDTGKGPVALLLHGWGSDHKTFTPLLPALAGYRVVAPDLPGFGGSQPPPEAWSVRDYAEFTSSLLKKLKITEVDLLIGHSFGGRISLEMLGLNLVPCRQAVLLASHGLPESASLKRSSVKILAKTGKVLTAAWPESTRNTLRRRLYRLAGSEDYLNSGVMKDTFVKIINQDATELASQIKSPVKLIYGDQDQTTPIRLGQRLEQLIPAAKLVVVSGAGHYVHIDQPQAVMSELNQLKPPK